MIRALPRKGRQIGNDGSLSILTAPEAYFLVSRTPAFASVHGRVAKNAINGFVARNAAAWFSCSRDEHQAASGQAASVCRTFSQSTWSVVRLLPYLVLSLCHVSLASLASGRT